MTVYYNTKCQQVNPLDLNTNEDMEERKVGANASREPDLLQAVEEGIHEGQ